jgi:hypothetical protein
MTSLKARMKILRACKASCLPLMIHNRISNKYLYFLCHRIMLKICPRKCTETKMSETFRPLKTS